MTGTWATADAGCPITASVSGGDEDISFVLGKDPNRLDLAFGPEALTRFLSIARDALAEFAQYRTDTTEPDNGHDDEPAADSREFPGDR